MSQISPAIANWIESLAAHRPWLTSVAAARLGGNQRQAEEIVGDVFFRISQRPPDPTSIQQVESWLYRSVVNQTLDWIRKRKPQSLDTGTDPNQSSPKLASQLPPLDMLIADEQRQSFSAAMDSLEPQHREILDLKYARGWSYTEIGDHLQLSFSAVANRLRSAKNQLKTKLLESDFHEDFQHLKEFKR